MRILRLLAVLGWIAIASPAPAADEPAAPPTFLKDVAPILVKNCIACHNARKSEGKYSMITFAAMNAGGSIEPGDPEASDFAALLKPDAMPRMPYKQDALPAADVAVIEAWIAAGAKYDGPPADDWTIALRKATPVTIPEAYPVAVPITALAFGPDGAEVAASGYHEINFWKAADGSLARRVRPLGERVYDIAQSPDGRWLATASGDPGRSGLVQIRALTDDATPPRDLAESTDCAFAVAFSPDGTKLAAAGADRAIRIWEVASGKELALIEDHADWIFDLAFSPDGKRLASASRDKTAKVFDVEKMEALVTYPGHAEAVYSVAFAPDGKLIATAGADAKVRIWNPDEDAKMVKSLGGFGGPVFKLLFAPDGKALYATGADRTVRIFNPASGSQTKALTGHTDWIYALALSPDGKALASGSWDGEVRLWNPADGTPLRTILAAPGFKPPGVAQASSK